MRLVPGVSETVLQAFLAAERPEEALLVVPRGQVLWFGAGSRETARRWWVWLRSGLERLPAEVREQYRIDRLADTVAVSRD